MLHFKPAGITWWRKPLVLVDGDLMPAELAVLKAELRPGELGVWLNSSSFSSGVAALQRVDSAGASFRTTRIPLPKFVTSALTELCQAAGSRRGRPDLVIWHRDHSSFRLIEVKCPSWDRPTPEQIAFLGVAAERGIPATVVEWEFNRGAA